ncbi:MAG: hypothetical protein ABEK84_00810 [Salinibacter sp.]
MPDPDQQSSAQTAAPQNEETTQERIDEQHRRAEELGRVDTQTLLLVLTEQMRDALVHLRALTREVVSMRAHLEDKDAEEALSELTDRLDRTAGEEELLRLKSIYDYVEAEGDLKDPE